MLVLGLDNSGLLPVGLVESLRGFEGEEDGSFQISDLSLKKSKAFISSHRSSLAA